MGIAPHGAVALFNSRPSGRVFISSAMYNIFVILLATAGGSVMPGPVVQSDSAKAVRPAAARHQREAVPRDIPKRLEARPIQHI